MIILISRSLTTSLSTIPTARNTANPLDSLSLHYKKTKILTLTILFLLILCILMETLSFMLLTKLPDFKPRDGYVISPQSTPRIPYNYARLTPTLDYLTILPIMPGRTL